MKKYNYIFIGGGSANLYSALELINNKVPGSEILIIEKGGSSFNMTAKDLLHNIGGAGLHSDCKLVLSEQSNHNLTKYLGLPLLKKYYTNLLQQIKRFHPNPDTINITEPTVDGASDKSIEGYGKLAMLQSTTWHIGNEYGKLMVQNIEKFLLNNGVTINTNERVNIVDRDLNLVSTNLTSYHYNNLIIATGRANSKFVNSFLEHNNIKLQKDYLDIGCRFEIEYTPTVQKIANKQYDFKFFNEELSARSFCVCHYSAFVSEETNNGTFLGYNGEGLGLHAHDDANGLTNFGILINEQNINADEVTELARNNKCMVIGDDFNFKSSLPNDNVITKEEFSKLPAANKILSFIEELKSVLNFGENYKIHYPEIKSGSGKLQSNNPSNRWQLDGINNIYFTGDSTFVLYDGGTRGIVPAAVSGIDAAQLMLQKRKETNV